MDEPKFEKRRYVRFVYEGEIEITDEMQSRVLYEGPGVRDAEGNFLGMLVTDGEEMWERGYPYSMFAVSMVMSEALHQNGPAAGFKWMGGGAYLRPSMDGQYAAYTVPEMPVRNDDGTYPPELGLPDGG